MAHKCPHCQKPIAVKLKTEILTQEQFLDEMLIKDKDKDVQRNPKDN